MNNMRCKFQQVGGEFGYVERRHKKGGGGSSTQYVQSPEAQKVLSAMLPAVKRVGRAGQYGQTLWDVPSYSPTSAPQIGGAPGVTGAPMPTEGWFSGMDPNIMSGLWEPYQQGSKQLMEQLGAAGMAGGAASGLSGTAAGGLGRFWEDASKNVGLSAWNMINPNAMAQWQMEQERTMEPWRMQQSTNLADWQAQNQASQNVWLQQLQARQAPYSIIPGMAGGAMPTPVQQQGGGGKK
jgi:hypothetical protein